jgi:transcriptional regulator with XRE-family HTH domain
VSITSTQARELGNLIAQARNRKGLTVEAQAAAMGISRSWLGDLELGRYLDPSPDRLVRLSEALDIEPSQIDRLTNGALAEALPGMRTYFRAKYDLTPEEASQVEQYVDRLRRAA